MKPFSIFRRSPISPLVKAVCQDMHKHPEKWSFTSDYMLGAITVYNAKGTVAIRVYQFPVCPLVLVSITNLFIDPKGNISGNTNLSVRIKEAINTREMLLLSRSCAKIIDKTTKSINCQLPTL
jgi:hypothetical protein